MPDFALPAGVLNLSEVEHVYLTNGCCEGFNEDDVLALGLPIGGWNPVTGKMSGSYMSLDDVPSELDPDPLTESESYFIADDSFATQTDSGMMMYSVLYNGKKFAAPTVEYWAGETPTPESWRELETCLTNDIAKARGMIERIGGHVGINLYDGPAEDRHTVLYMIPMNYLTSTWGGPGAYASFKNWLESLWR